MPLANPSQYTKLAAGNGNIGIKGIEDSFWYNHKEINKNNWNQLYPYQLILVDNNYSAVNTFTLPIPPQELNISMPFAISTDVTLGGIIEQHNGIPIRPISFSGTTGILPLRGSPISSSGVFGGLFSGVKQAATDVANNFQKLFSSNSLPSSLSKGSVLDTSGYNQFRLLQRWLEDYASLKKTSKGKDYRLALALWKDEAVYLVTPVAFNVNRSASVAFEYTYNLSFKAWKRIQLNIRLESTDIYTPVGKDKELLGSVFKKISEVRKVLYSTANVATSIRRDFNEILDISRQTVLSLKETLGMATTLVDMPSSIVKDMKGAIAEYKTLNGDVNRLEKSVIGVQDSLDRIFQTTTKRNKNVTKGGDLVVPKIKQNTHYLSSRDLDPTKNFDFLDSINISNLKLPPATIEKVNKEALKAKELTRSDFEKNRDKTLKFLTNFAENIGAGAETYNTVFNLNSSNVQREPTEAEFNLLFNLNMLTIEYSRLCVSNSINQNTITTMDYLAGAASRSGIAFKVPTSKYAVPFPYGSTLEMLSKNYLKDPDRWMEIAALNGLQTPYVDEIGFSLDLLVNGRSVNGSNEIYVDSAENLYLNQLVWIESDAVNRSQRRINEITKVEIGYKIVLDGDSDIDSYTVNDDAFIQTFLPNTVNSRKMIYIPSDEPATEEDLGLKEIPGIDIFDKLIKASGVDFLVDSNNDLVIDPNGELLYSYGLTELTQKIKILLATPKGSLLHYPDFGIPSLLGVSQADINLDEVRQGISNILKDYPEFSGVENIAISMEDGTVLISFSAVIASTGQFIPVSFEMNN